MSRNSNRVAAIDIGTNTTLLLVAEYDEPLRAIAERAEITRLGRGIGGDGRLRPDNVRRTLEVLKTFAHLAHECGAPIHAVGTEALRRAPNAADFLNPARDILGVPVQVVDGEQEAALSFLATHRSFPDLARDRLVVIDIGGGSTEVILAKAGEMIHRVSLPLGSVRLTETHITADPAPPQAITDMRVAIGLTLDQVPLREFCTADKRPPALIGTAGTVTTLAAMAQGLSTYDPARVHGFRLNTKTLAGLAERLASTTQAEREAMPGLDPRRADVILTGAVLLHEIALRTGASEVVASDRGVRWGLAYMALPQDPNAS